jgi:hypothetical protein
MLIRPAWSADDARFVPERRLALQVLLGNGWQCLPPRAAAAAAMLLLLEAPD